ncbi:hypothetical protein Nos7524_1075 [Nostoc sp. PCC 7524]|nr:hypothetical protein Nos7524_1075 [Nostoc sp. PCC 7524]
MMSLLPVKGDEGDEGVGEDEGEGCKSYSRP